MKFLDQAKIYIKAGDGGEGCVSFHREKFVEFGGPNGGDGGKGGNVIVTAVANLNTLIDFRYQQHFKAQKGQHGMGRNRSGHKGEDLILKVPVGTQILDEDKETILFDLTEPGQTITLAKGGNGGFGNAHFKTSTNQAPRHANPGLPGEECWIWLQLKLIADAGLMGMPNAGKSTLLSVLTNARPKIADYPFTTLNPNLGVIQLENEEYILADIPGLIEGAHEGIGLGTKFLGHIERCKAILHVIDATAEDVVANYQVVQDELGLYDHGILDKPQLIALNKCDALTPEIVDTKQKELFQLTGQKIYTFSAISGQGLKEVLYALITMIKDETT